MRPCTLGSPARKFSSVKKKEMKAGRRPRAAPTVREGQILDAAGRLFRRQGFAATSLRDIAAEGGLLIGSIHYRYATKEAILVALMERAIAHVMHEVRVATERTADPVERLRLGLAAHLRALLAGDDAVYVLLYDWRVLQGEAREATIRLRDRYEAFWDGILYAAAGSGMLRATVDLKLLRLFGFGAINWVATWYRPDGPLRPDDIASAFFSTMALGALAEGAPMRGGPGERVAPASPHRRTPRRRSRSG